MLEQIVLPKNLIKRPILEGVSQEVLKGEKIVLLLGPRQSGKTSLIYLLIKKLLMSKKINPKQLFYFDAERINTTTLLNDFTNTPEDFLEYLKTRQADIEKKTFIFIDEIQYLLSPSRLLKYLYDHYKNLVFVVSGSSSLEIKQKFADRLTGRNRSFHVRPLTFASFLTFTGHSLEADYLSNVKANLRKKSFSEVKLDKEMLTRLTHLFENFVVVGGYPGVVKKQTLSEQVVELEGIYSDYVRKDIRDLANIEDTIAYNSLVGLLAGQVGSLVRETELANSSALSRPTVRKYLALLEGTFVIATIAPFYKNPRQEFVKMPKIYFLDSGMRNMVLKNFDNLSSRVDKGTLVENTVFNQLKENLGIFEELYFWRTQAKAEVDFILRGEKNRLTPIEVKYQPFKKPKVPLGLRSFLNRYQPKKGLVLTRDFWGQTKINKSQVVFLPVWTI